MAMRGFFLDNGAFEKYSHRISARRMLTILRKASDSTMFPDDPDKGDKLFSPKTPQEAEYWKILRDEIKQSANRYLSNRENGKRGGRPPKTPAPQQEGPEQPPKTELTPQEKAARAAKMAADIGKKLGDKSPYKKITITDDLDLTRLDGAIGDALRLAYPPNRSDTLVRLSKWLRGNMIGVTADAKWLNDQATKFYNPRR